MGHPSIVDLKKKGLVYIILMHLFLQLHLYQKAMSRFFFFNCSLHCILIDIMVILFEMNWDL